MAENISNHLYRDGEKLDKMEIKVGTLNSELGYSNYLLGDIEKLTN